MYRQLIVPLDRSPLAEQALTCAAAIARAATAELDLVLVHQLMPFRAIVGAPWSHAQARQEDTYLATVATELGGGGVPASHVVMHGATVEMICRRAFDIGADLIVMTSHGRTGLGRAWLGSVADGVLRHSAIPVLMLHPEEGSARGKTMPEFKRMLVPLDGSALATEILRPALDLATCLGAGIVLVQVVPPVPALMPDPLAPDDRDEAATRVLVDDARDHLAGAARCLRERGVTDITCRVVVSVNTAQGILDAAQASGSDIIAMSTHGRGASRLLVGSVADMLLASSHLPLLIHHPLGAEGNAGFLSAETIAGELPALSNG